MKQYVITPAAGKRLIGKAVAIHPAVKQVIKSGTLVIIAGTTNGYAAEEILKSIGDTGDFKRDRFFRGITLAPSGPASGTGRLADQRGFPGDVVIVDGKRIQEKTIFDVADGLKEGDVILKGANAVDVVGRRAGILRGHPKGGTIAAALQAVTGKRVKLILPVGLEKRVNADLDAIAETLNSPGARGPRFWPVPGEVVTELQAVSLLTGATAELTAAGGVGGAEGSVWLAVTGTPEEEEAAGTLLGEIIEEPLFFPE